MSPFLADYLIFVFWATVGAIQVGASVGRYDGLLLVRHPLAARTLGIALTVGAVLWFFLSEERNINDIHGGLDANLQGVGFFGGAAMAVIATLGISSLIHARLRRGDPSSDEGIEALRKTSYLATIRACVPDWWDGSPRRLLRFFSGDLQSGVVGRLSVAAARFLMRRRQDPCADQDGHERC